MQTRTLFRTCLLLLVLACTSLVASAKAPDPREVIGGLDKIVNPKGIQESFKLKIGGVDQWVYTRGQDVDNPVILFIHGGPASPLAPVMWTYQRPLEEYFTVVNYDQRGSGKSFLETDPEVVGKTLTIDRYVQDAIELATQIRDRYKKRKVILAAHSWGTVIGMKAALLRPDLFYAYVGIGQAINVHDNERISVEYGLEQAKLDHNETAIKELESISPYPGDKPITRDRIIIARKWPQYYGGLTAFRHDSDYFFNAPSLSPDYDDKAVAAIDQGNMLTLGRILDEFLNVDYKPVKRFPIPVVMFMGRHDYTTPSEPTQAWLDRVEAPYKKGVWFENSAHMMPMEEPGKFLISFLDYVRPLATDNVASATKASR
jgi:pimeloyl-ACP methyl ester carboxylesterase